MSLNGGYCHIKLINNSFIMSMIYELKNKKNENMRTIKSRRANKIFKKINR